MKIYLLRHGAIQGFDRKTYIGQSDLPLSAEGIDQAIAWHRFFQDILPEKIVCSDLERSLHTAKIIAGPSSGGIQVQNAFREISLGRWEGIPMKEIRKNFPEQWALRGRNLKGFRPPGGESFSDLAKRVLPAFHQLCAYIQSDTVIVAHAGVNRVILAELMGADLNAVLQIPQDYAAGNLIEISQEERYAVYVNKVPDQLAPPVASPAR